MASDPTNFDRPSIDAPTLISATLYLLSAFITNGCPRLAILIKQHLELLASHTAADPLVRSTSAQLIDKYWARTAISASEILRKTDPHDSVTDTPSPLSQSVH